MVLEESRIAEHRELTGGYRWLVLEAPRLAGAARPGQFVHLRVPALDSAVLRRPFSICLARDGAVTLLYKRVGAGTEALARLGPGAAVSLMGPLGNGFPLDRADSLPVLVAGGYGVAPLYFLASRLPAPGVFFAGGATAKDVLCTAEVAALGWPVHVATEDGSRGARGYVTGALDAWLAAEGKGRAVEFYACGPDGLLRAVGDRAKALGVKGWLSMDKHMGCGVGACLACVQRIRMPDGKESWLRTCREGPVFEAGSILWE